MSRDPVQGYNWIPECRPFPIIFPTLGLVLCAVMIGGGWVLRRICRLWMLNQYGYSVQDAVWERTGE